MHVYLYVYAGCFHHPVVRWKRTYTYSNPAGNGTSSHSRYAWLRGAGSAGGHPPCDPSPTARRASCGAQPVATWGLGPQLCQWYSMPCPCISHTQIQRPLPEGLGVRVLAISSNKPHTLSLLSLSHTHAPENLR
jgi:hypothetical protein